MESRLLVFALALATALSAADGASASQLIDRNATNVRLEVDAKGRALVTYVADGRLKRVLAWGAINALPPSRDRPQARFRLDYAGGWGTYRREVWRTFGNVCGPYHGPPLAWLVVACTAPDGSHWALQGFPQPLPNLGFAPWLPEQSARWLELSHWRGPLASLEVWRDWIYNGHYQRLFGRYTYAGRPVYGFGTSPRGAPTDDYGRLLYLDTYGSVYGPGWRRENSFVSHRPNGVFCYGFFPVDPLRGGYERPPGDPGRPRGPGTGTRYRLTARGPGVTPDVLWHGPGLHAYDPARPSDRAHKARTDAAFRRVVGVDRACRLEG